MVYGLWRPPTPFTVPQRFYDMYNSGDMEIPGADWQENDLSDVPSWGVKLVKVWGVRFNICGESDPEAWKKLIHAYSACTTFADWSAGRVLETLENSEYAKKYYYHLLSG